MTAVDGLPTDRHIAYTKGKVNGIDHRVSTVSLLPAYEGDKYPYETMVFYGDDFADHYCDRYATAEEAAEGHQRIVSALLGGTLEMY